MRTATCGSPAVTTAELHRPLEQKRQRPGPKALHQPQSTFRHFGNQAFEHCPIRDVHDHRIPRRAAAWPRRCAQPRQHRARLPPTHKQSRWKGHRASAAQNRGGAVQRLAGAAVESSPVRGSVAKVFTVSIVASARRGVRPKEAWWSGASLPMWSPSSPNARDLGHQMRWKGEM